MTGEGRGANFLPHAHSHQHTCVANILLINTLDTRILRIPYGTSCMQRHPAIRAPYFYAHMVSKPYLGITSRLPVTRPESGPMIPSPKPKGETCVAGTIETLRSRDQCLPYGCRCSTRRGDRADELSTRERETETRVFDIADGRA